MILETKRLILRPFKLEDAADLYEYLKEPLVNCFSCMKLNSIEEAKELILNRMNEELDFAIILKETGKVIGEINAHLESVSPIDSIKDTYSPCWMLNKDYHGNGYAYEAVYAFFDYLFNSLNARRIYAYTEDYNISCQKLCEKLGMRKEGVFKEFVSFISDNNGNPIYENTLQYAILKKEWVVK